MRKALNLSLTAKYVFVLTLIAITTLLSHYAITKLLEVNESSAAIINAAGRQRMLSQRVASFAAQYALGSKTAQADLTKTIAQFEQNTLGLREKINARQQTSSAVFSSDILATDDSIDVMITAYLTRAKKIAGMSIHNPALQSELLALLDEAREPILKILDNMVSNEQQFAERQMRSVANLQKITFLVIMLTLLTSTLTVFRPMVKNTSQLLHLATFDSLTGALTRRAFCDRANNELARASRYAKPLSLLMIDVDYFKNINDIFGHGGGDAALVTLTSHLQQSLRTSDFIGRLGGEEFAIILSETNLEEACVVAERYRTTVSDLKMPYGGEFILFTISIGVAAISDKLSSLELLIDAADKALYQAKNGGRNQIVRYQSPG